MSTRSFSHVQQFFLALIPVLLLLSLTAPRHVQAQTPVEVIWHAGWEFDDTLNGVLTITAVSGKTVLRSDEYDIPCTGTVDHEDGVVRFQRGSMTGVKCTLDIDRAIDLTLAALGMKRAGVSVPAYFWTHARVRLDGTETAPILVQPKGATRFTVAQNPAGRTGLLMTTGFAKGSVQTLNKHPEGRPWLDVYTHLQCALGKSIDCSVQHTANGLLGTTMGRQTINGSASFHTGPADLWIGFDPQSQESFDGALDWLEIDPNKRGHD